MTRARRSARIAAAALLAASVSLSAARIAHALVWPDVAERVERDLGAPDAATRRAAARQIADLGPERGDALALAALGDADDDVRLAAADAAIHLRAAGATDAVTGWLNAPDARLRRKACEVARALPDPRAIAPLARTLGDADPDVRSAAADALGRQAASRAVPPLLGRLDDPTPAVRVQIVAALARLGDPRAIVPLVGKVQDSSQEVRRAVAQALGDLGDVRAAPALVQALRDPNDEVRREALSSLGRLRAADAVDSIAPLVSDRNASLRAAAVEALGAIASPPAVRALVDALGRGDDAAASLERTPVRAALVAAGDAAIDPLRAVLAGSSSPSAAAGAAWVLGELHARRQAPEVVAALRRGALPPAAALHALAGAGTAADVPVVLELLSDPSPAVRREALATAAALLDPTHPDGRAVEPLAAALRDPRASTDDRARIASLLGRTGAPRAAPLLVGLTRSTDPALRLAAIDALGDVGAPVAEDALLDALASTDAVSRLHAAVALSRAGGPGARDRLLALLDAGDEIDRSAVLTALGGVLARAPSDEAVGRLAHDLDLAAGPERDAILEALGRAPGAASAAALAAAAHAGDPSDRRQAASMLAAHPADPAAVATARALLADPDPSVRAQAAWSLGSIGASSDVAGLVRLARGRDLDAAVDAAAAIGRIASRARRPDVASGALCPLVTDPRAYVRANALAGLALASARCAGGSPERAALASDPDDDVRAAAALAVAVDPSADDVRALARCAHTDPSGAVAARCRSRAAPRPAGTQPVLVYVVAGAGSTPRPGAAYAMLEADGTLRTGTTDRRGAVCDPVAPDGELSLRPASALAR